MKLDVTRQLTNLDGSSLVQPGTRCTTCGHITDPEPVTLRVVLTTSLVTQTRDQKPIEGDEKAKRWALAIRIQQEDAPELALKELELVQRLVGEIQPTLTAGQVWVMLEGDGAEGASG